MLDLQALAINRRNTGDKFFEEGSLADEDQVKRGEFSQTGDAGWNNAAGTEVPAHCINRDDRGSQGLLGSALVDHFATAVETVRRNVVAQVNFTGALLYGQCVGFEGIVGTTHIACRAGFFVLLNSHNQLTPKRLGHALTAPVR
jgi:hypothetical protein